MQKGLGRRQGGRQGDQSTTLVRASVGVGLDDANEMSEALLKCAAKLVDLRLEFQLG
jgi:hypothetical protein